MSFLISVIVPVYKVEDYLDRCVESIIRQTYVNLEIILVDDGSPDNCPKMCDAWAKKDSRIRVVHKENGGLSSARNAALDIATGDYISFVDSDDMIASNAMELLAECVADSGSEVVISTRPIKFSRKPTLENGNLIAQRTVSPEQALEIVFCENTRWEAWGTLYHRRLFEQQRFPVGKIYEDISTVPAVILLAKSVNFADTAIYYYFERPSSIMHANGNIVKIDLFDAVKNDLILFDTIDDQKTQCNVKAGILEELLSRVHFAYAQQQQNKAFIENSVKLAKKNTGVILKAKRISLKRKLFMLSVMWGISKHIKKWN